MENPTYYQSIKLYTTGLAALALLAIEWQQLSKKLRIFWGLIIIACTSLSIDEIVQLHEKIPYFASKIFGKELISSLDSQLYTYGYTSHLWLLVGIPLLFAVTFTIVIFTKTLYSRYKRDCLILLLMNMLFVVVLYCELKSTSGAVNHVYHSWVIIEEFAEMLSITALLWFVFGQLAATITSVLAKISIEVFKVDVKNDTIRL